MISSRISACSMYGIVLYGSDWVEILFLSTFFTRSLSHHVLHTYVCREKISSCEKKRVVEYFSLGHVNCQCQLFFSFAASLRYCPYCLYSIMVSNYFSLMNPRKICVCNSI